MSTFTSHLADALGYARLLELSMRQALQATEGEDLLIQRSLEIIMESRLPFVVAIENELSRLLPPLMKEAREMQDLMRVATPPAEKRQATLIRQLPNGKALSWETQFPAGYAVPSWLPEFFVDVSWGNDACPTFALPVHDQSEVRCRIWSEHPDAAKREFEGPHRFTVTDGTDKECIEILATDDGYQVRSLMVQPVNEQQAEAWIFGIKGVIKRTMPDATASAALITEGFRGRFSAELTSHLLIAYNNCVLLLGQESVYTLLAQ